MVGGDVLGHINQDSILPALIQTFGIIATGFYSRKAKLIDKSGEKGLSTFVGVFALPFLIFGNLITLQFGKLNLTFLLAIFLAKCFIFALVLIPSYLTITEQRLSKSALFSIFVTQSNDFALGLPLLNAIYGQTHPECMSYLYLFAPISLAILNPIGFLLLELELASNSSSVSPQDGLQERVSSVRRWSRVATSVFFGLIQNPIMMMTVAGIAFNLIFQATGSGPPEWLDNYFQSIGGTFSVTALFLLGMSMVDKGNVLLSSNNCIVAVLLILVKSIIFPIACRRITMQLIPSDTNHHFLADFAFIYGTFPTAPGVFVYATRYNVSADFIAGSMIIGTLFAAPVMYICVKLITIEFVDPVDYVGFLNSFLLDVAILGFLASIVLLVLFRPHGREQITKAFSYTFQFMFMLFVCQSLACVGKIVGNWMPPHSFKRKMFNALSMYGIYGSRLSLVTVSICLYFELKAIHNRTSSSQPFFICAFITSVLLPSIIVLTIVSFNSVAALDVDPNFLYGRNQAIASLIILTSSFMVCSVLLVLNQRLSNKLFNGRLPSEVHSVSSTSSSVGDSEEVRNEERLSTEELIMGSSDQDNDDIMIDVEQREQCKIRSADSVHHDNAPPTYSDRYRSHYIALCSHTTWSRSSIGVVEGVTERKYLPLSFDSSHIRSLDETVSQIRILIIFLLYLIFTMLIGLSLSMWFMIMDEMNGLYLGLAIFDSFLNYSQPIFGLLLFARIRLINTFLCIIYAKLKYGSQHPHESCYFQPWFALQNTNTATICSSFIERGLHKKFIAFCRRKIDQRTIWINWFGGSGHCLFKGKHLVTWLIQNNVCESRGEGVELGRSLLKGKIIRHVVNGVDFHDGDHTYDMLPLLLKYDENIQVAPSYSFSRNNLVSSSSFTVTPSMHGRTSPP